MASEQTNTLRATRLGPLALLVALAPALSRWVLPQLPAGSDTAVHFFRAVELDWLIGNGVFYSRWLPDLVFGYGYPLFNYYGPLANYLIVALHRLGLDFTPATLAAFAGADLLGAFGAYLLARDTLGRLPGLVTAIAYAYSPYLLASLYRGALPEALGLGLLPWLLWAFYRLWQTPTAGWMAVAGAVLALLPPTHNPSAALGAVILAVFVLALAIVGRTRKQVGATFAALTLGLGLSAFFWLPIPFELQYIDIAKAYGPTVINYHYNFMSLAQVFALPKALDPNLIGGSISFGLGLPQAILALAALLVWRNRTRTQKVLLGLAAVAVPVLVCLTLPQAVPVWERLPGLSLIQFPGRLLGPASLMLALLGGSVFVDTPRLKWLVIASAAMIVFGFGWMYTAVDRSIPNAPTVTDIQAYEHRTGVVGTTTAAEYLPKWVEQRPADESLQAEYAEGTPIKRFDAGSLPSGGQVISETAGVLTQTVEVESPSDFSAKFKLFYFPGWAAMVDGVSANVTPEVGSGLALVQVPAGNHTVQLQFTDTQPRTVGWLVSGMALIILVVLGVRGWQGTKTQVGEATRGGLDQGTVVAIAVVGLAALGIKLGYADQARSFFLQKRFDGQTLQGMQYPLDVGFGDQLQLLGYDETPSGVVLYWRALQALDTDWSVSVTADYAGRKVAQADVQHPAGLPTNRWSLDDYARDEHLLVARPGTPPGTYDLRVTVYRQSDGMVLQGGVKIGEWVVARPSAPTLVTPSIPVDAHFGPIVLYGVDLAKEVRVGDDLPVTLYWRADGTTPQDIKPEVQLVNSEGKTIASEMIAPVETGYGTSEWQAGDGWVGLTSIRVGADIAGGDYTLKIVTPDGPYALGGVKVIAPERVYAMPKIRHLATVPFEKAGTLLGWGYEADTLTLYWQASETATSRYSVFVHAVDADGNIVAQRDSVPVNGTRPTTSWLADEVITDSYALPLPPETTGIQVGLYDPATGERLKTADGSDFVLIQP
jgi:6-pyruvoyl-tetrahydropterin synthase related domain